MTADPRMLDRADAERLASRTDFIWHQRFALGSDVYSPGRNDIEWLVETAAAPGDLTGKTVLDIGTANGASAFIAERRGAAEVIAVDVVGEDHFGFRSIKEALGSGVQFMQSDIYVLPELLDRQFDIVRLRRALSPEASRSCARQPQTTHP